ncbi:hypothetical protein I317_04195 [Kwoniella heveanensis CBS 569]|nr:hypothetical protein I317_04195 [Kwoniella heveanensis CBS 569]
MPIASEGSASPPMRQPSLEPERNAAGPSTSRKYGNSIVDQQRRQVEKLLSNPERNVQLPTATKEKTLRAPREMMKNVQGSSAGAGSGEFHVYKQSRRREYERLKLMDEKARAEEERAAFLARQAEREAAAEAKTSKNRAKRQKRKAGRSGGPGGPAGKAIPSSDPSSLPNGNGAGGVVKRKLEGGAKVVFKRPGEDDDDDNDGRDREGQGSGSEGEVEEVGPTPEVGDARVPEVSHQEVPRVVEEPKITIVDED